MDVLMARIEVVLRRSERPSSPRTEPETLVVGDMRIDPAAHTIAIGDHLVELPPREFDLLHVLALEAGHVVSTDDLLDRVWGPEYAGEPQVIYVHVRWLRQAIEEDPHNPRRITTVRGVGYKLESQEP
jgi:DNA-binding response OmpR family regulator